MKIKLTSLGVDDQDKALKFYTEVLGFVKKQDFPAGGARWITVVSPEGPQDVELALEPGSHPAFKVFQAAMMKDGIPLAMFQVDDIQAEYQRLKKHHVVFTMEPTRTGPVTTAIFSDTCGNLISLFQP